MLCKGNIINFFSLGKKSVLTEIVFFSAMLEHASIHLSMLIGNLGFKFFNKKYQNCSSACVFFYMSALCSGCLHYAPSSHSKAPHNHFK